MYRVDLSVVAWTMPIDDAHLMAIFQDNLGKQVSECLNYDFIGAKDDGGGGDKYDVQSSSKIIITNISSPNILQAWCPSCCATNSVRALKGGLIPINSEIFTTEQKRNKIGPQKLQSVTTVDTGNLHHDQSLCRQCKNGMTKSSITLPPYAFQ